MGVVPTCHPPTRGPSKMGGLLERTAPGRWAKWYLAPNERNGSRHVTVREKTKPQGGQSGRIAVTKNSVVMCHRLDAKRGTRPNAPSLRGADRQRANVVPWESISEPILYGSICDIARGLMQMPELAGQLSDLLLPECII